MLQLQRPSLLVGIKPIRRLRTHWLNITIRIHWSYELFLSNARTMARRNKLHLVTIYLSDNGRHGRSDSEQGYQ
jgi:hypothetical protein